MKFGPIDYESTSVPKAYQCADCGARNVKLWRGYNMFLSHLRLRCCDCAAKAEKKIVQSVDTDGIVFCEGDRSDQIGRHVPAVPTPEGETFWGYSSVPNAGVRWWKQLRSRSGMEAQVLPPAAPDLPKPDYRPEIAKWQKEAAFVVEATSYEAMCLWRDWHLPKPGETLRTEDETAKVSWEQINPGCLVEVGQLNKLPVCVSLTFARLAGRVVVFWHPTSLVVDHRQIETWFRANIPAYARMHRCDAMNFHLCVSEILMLSHVWSSSAF